MNGPTDTSISPGIGGFIVFFLLAVALWLLMRNMVGRLRNVDFREELEEERRAARGRDMTSRPTSATASVPDAPSAGPVDADVGDADQVDADARAAGQGGVGRGGAHAAPAPEPATHDDDAPPRTL